MQQGVEPLTGLVNRDRIRWCFIVALMHQKIAILSNFVDVITDIA